MLTDAQGRPLTTDGRFIKIVETDMNGKKVWAVDYSPSIQAFEFEEVFQVLGNVIAGVAQNARARKHEAMMQHQMKEKISELEKEK